MLGYRVPGVDSENLSIVKIYRPGSADRLKLSIGKNYRVAWIDSSWLSAIDSSIVIEKI